MGKHTYKTAFHDTDILADILARIVARMSVSVWVSWNAGYRPSPLSVAGPLTRGVWPLLSPSTPLIPPLKRSGC